MKKNSIEEKYCKEIFKAYDIRGIVETQLTANLVEKIGKVLGSLTLEAKEKGLVVGFDGRLSSLILAKNLIQGILSSGCDVYDIGEVTTPMVYFANYELGTNSGVMITGSHNPPEYNGLKMVIGGITLSGEKIQEIYTRIENNEYREGIAGKYILYYITETYFNKIMSDITLSRSINVIVDCGNGVAGKIAPKLYRRLGARVLGLYCNVDGNFPNHHPDPSQPDNLLDLKNALKVTEADVGLAFDGDGDRLGLVTKDGNIIYPDRMMMLFVADILSKNDGAKIIYDVKSSRLLKNWIEDHGGVPLMCRTGHSFVKSKIRETGALFAGEMSGHIFFNDRWKGFDDAIYAGARMLEVLSQVDDISALLNALPNAISTPEINILVQEGEQHVIIEKLRKTAKFSDNTQIIDIDGLRVEYEDGFGLVRASNTTPVLVLRFEADTEIALERIKKQFRKILSKYIKKVTF